MLITSDWHTHTFGSWDGRQSLAALRDAARAEGLSAIGVAEHFNWPSWANTYFQKTLRQREQADCPEVHFGIELTTIARCHAEYDLVHNDLDGFVRPDASELEALELPVERELLDRAGVKYVIGAAHWGPFTPPDLESMVREFYRQDLYIACDPRVDIVGHPFSVSGLWNLPGGGKGPFNDFGLITRSMRDEFAAAMKQHGKLVEYNLNFAVNPNFPESFRQDYADYIRELFERGVGVTFGSDNHGPHYASGREKAEKYLAAAGFRPGDLTIPPNVTLEA